jgi:1-acyl-sn-glycerol-3-phosphate acyltransferase
MAGRPTDRPLGGVAILVLRAFFRTVEVRDRHRIPLDRPVIVVANHFYGFVDPVLVVGALRRMPRFLAKATLWRNPLAAVLLNIVGVLKVQRSVDGEGTAGNVKTFDACHRALRKDGVVALFPEGTTHDDPRLHTLRTGAARIALGARADGAKGLVIVPIGLVYDDKVALRSRVLAQVGEPIDLDEHLRDYVGDGEPTDETNHLAVEKLTHDITDRLQAVVPDFDDWREEAACNRAAAVVVRDTLVRRGAATPLGERTEIAGRLARTDADARHHVLDALAAYELDLDVLRARDEHLQPMMRRRTLYWRAFIATVIFILLTPFLLGGIIANAVPYLLTRWAGRAVSAPVTKGTVRFLVAMVTFPISWLVYALVTDFDQGWGATLLAFVLAPIFGYAVVIVAERVTLLIDTWRAVGALRDRQSLIPQVLEDRAAVVTAVELAP